MFHLTVRGKEVPDQTTEARRGVCPEHLGARHEAGLAPFADHLLRRDGADQAELVRERHPWRAVSSRGGRARAERTGRTPRVSPSPTGARAAARSRPPVSLPEGSRAGRRPPSPSRLRHPESWRTYCVR
ncbi:hypothetical protein Sdia_46080 [Streptomyces diastaticus subsp. diastaticus]|uniref:Uncharacterized protein n=1 Tax=Streptomyces diastaticus subsp. diastaticus TaxID=68040 RepID=A0ABQ1CU42_STRDI|nr:hypothetical protein Sdia_46080 [Streptomyces diastaticus subsp. diastaticus]GGU06896.1 hypothetical protein GCM10015534_05900 [Streptomyces diastaticus subsp. diastaticus]